MQNEKGTLIQRWFYQSTCIESTFIRSKNYAEYCTTCQEEVLRNPAFLTLFIHWTICSKQNGTHIAWRIFCLMFHKRATNLTIINKISLLNKFLTSICLDWLDSYDSNSNSDSNKSNVVSVIRSPGFQCNTDNKTSHENTCFISCWLVNIYWEVNL